MNAKPQGPIENLLDGLSRHAELLSDEELKIELSARGIDVGSFLKQATTIIATHQKAERLAWMKVADDKKHAIRASGVRAESWLEKGEQAIRAAFAELIRTAMPQQTIAFRNKTGLTTEDMARILDDHERLKSRISGQPTPDNNK